MQVADLLSETLGTKNVAVVLDARHLCVEMRGVRDSDAVTTTMELRGSFADEHRQELLQQLR